jgi:hypothetical protein
MRKIITLLLLLLISKSFAQNSLYFYVLDSISKQPIPHLKIFVKEKDMGTYSNEKGFVQFNNLADNDTLLIDNIFYRREILPIIKIRNNNEIFLSPKPYIINEIIVSPSKNKKIEIGYSKSRSKGSFGTQIIGTEIAVLIKPGNIHNPYISYIVLKFKKILQNTVVRVHLYQNELGLPGSEIYLKDNLITLSDKKEAKYNISNQYIKLPIKGVFVSMEWIGNNKVSGQTYDETEFKSSPRVRALTIKKKDKAIGLVRIYGKWKSLMDMAQQEDKVYIPLFGLVVEEHK